LKTGAVFFQLSLLAIEVQQGFNIILTPIAEALLNDLGMVSELFQVEHSVFSER
jgi:hypothetical protein